MFLFTSNKSRLMDSIYSNTFINVHELLLG